MQKRQFERHTTGGKTDTGRQQHHDIQAPTAAARASTHIFFLLLTLSYVHAPGLLFAEANPTVLASSSSTRPETEAQPSESFRNQVRLLVFSSEKGWPCFLW